MGKKVSEERAHHVLEAKVAPEDGFDFYLCLIRQVCKALRPRCARGVLAWAARCEVASRPRVPGASVRSGPRRRP